MSAKEIKFEFHPFIHSIAFFEHGIEDNNCLCKRSRTFERNRKRKKKKSRQSVPAPRPSLRAELGFSYNGSRARWPSTEKHARDPETENRE